MPSHLSVCKVQVVRLAPGPTKILSYSATYTSAQLAPMLQSLAALRVHPSRYPSPHSRHLKHPSTYHNQGAGLHLKRGRHRYNSSSSCRGLYQPTAQLRAASLEHTAGAAQLLGVLQVGGLRMYACYAFMLGW
jgi:hypothetical protein